MGHYMSPFNSGKRDVEAGSEEEFDMAKFAVEEINKSDPVNKWRLESIAKQGVYDLAGKNYLQALNLRNERDAERQFYIVVASTEDGNKALLFAHAL